MDERLETTTVMRIALNPKQGLPLRVQGYGPHGYMLRA